MTILRKVEISYNIGLISAYSVLIVWFCDLRMAQQGAPMPKHT